MAAFLHCIWEEIMAVEPLSPLESGGAPFQGCSTPLICRTGHSLLTPAEGVFGVRDLSNPTTLIFFVIPTEFVLELLQLLTVLAQFHLQVVLT